ncbi:uncharacterized protein LOC129727645 [Wyeomyia smithii]|uniref:uncharacterized protein LOC129727645 n=1 Tax=Wyeomyia smithii TaxID=174621 RepID=UPI00246800A5|nr:uncharacterized protein LOC129727645 [Wyeomyia smithii]
MEQTLSSLDDESDYFRQMEFSLVAAGVQIRTSRPLYLFAFYVYRLIILLHFSLWYDRFFDNLSDEERLGELITSLAFCAEFSSLLLRGVVVRIYLSKIRRVQDYLSERLSDCRYDYRNKTYRLICRIVTTFQIMFFLDMLLQFKFVKYQTFFDMPKNVLQLGILSTVLGYRVDLVADFFFATVFTAHLTIVNTYMMAFDVEMRKIVDALQSLFGDVEAEIEDTWQKQGLIRTVNSAEELRFLEVLKRKLGTIVQDHVELLSQLEQLKGFLQVSFMVMFYLQMVTVGGILFYITSQKLTALAVVLASYVCVLMLECYWYCKLSDNLNETNNNIGWAVYNLDWPQKLRYHPAGHRTYREIRTTLLLILVNSQKSLGINCGGLFEMKTETFAYFLNLCYKCLMFLPKRTG